MQAESILEPTQVQAQPPPKLTDRQRVILRAYFASGCKPVRAAAALGMTRRRIHEVKALPGARQFIEDMHAQAQTAMVNAHAAQVMAPLLK